MSEGEEEKEETGWIWEAVAGGESELGNKVGGILGIMIEGMGACEWRNGTEFKLLG